MLVNIFKFSFKIRSKISFLCDYVNLYFLKKNISQTSIKFSHKIIFKIIESYFTDLVYFVYSKSPQKLLISRIVS